MIGREPNQKGDMRNTLVVVDDFYPDPDAVLGRALRLEYRQESGVNYPGLMAATFQDVVPIMKRFAQLLGGIDIKFQGTQGGFRITTEADMVRRNSLVHLDSSDFSAVIHLSRQPMEGTYFYRHRELGLDYVAPTLRRNAAVEEALVRDTLRLEAWEVVDTIPMKYNRLVIFDGKHFHSGARTLTGAAAADGRITQNFFFDRDLEEAH